MLVTNSNLLVFARSSSLRPATISPIFKMMGFVMENIKNVGVYLAKLLNTNPITSLSKNTTAERAGEHDMAKIVMKAVIRERLSSLEVDLVDKRMSIEVADIIAAGSAQWMCRQAVFALFLRASHEVEGLKARLNAEVTLDGLEAILIALQEQERAVRAIQGSYNLFLTALIGRDTAEQVEIRAAENWVKRIHQNHPAAPTPQSGV
ncbi:hypothetical protein ARMGADRAFT_1062066 [Armillaria gallica]|uniref:Uncharacterized protein n=1 Tax=Armillaria gallica TaxID=47427 RepID=A0A2H3DJR0_ARMGA|nr:hypothetical protein ARMGADRAFT_1062066 [Armillaria gallica]